MHITIGEKILDIMSEKGLNKKDLSNPSKMNGESFSKTFAYKIANENYDSSDSKTLIKLSKAFNVSVDYLLDINKEKSCIKFK